MTNKTTRTYSIAEDTRGSTLLFILVFGAAAFTIIVSGVSSYALFEHRASIRYQRRDLAFHIAEAGINYYRWHLAHNSTDYQDGTGLPGPYVHPYEDKDGNTIGYFSLQIQPPLSGTTVVMVSSTGWTVWEPTVQRTVQVRLGFPALTDYTFLTNANMLFSFTSLVNGAIHSNGGIRFDGTSDSWVRSAKDRYEYQPNQWRNGIWGSGGSVSGGNGDKSFWQFPVPHIDFFSVTADLAALESMANNGGVHLSSSGNEGWHIVFNGTTYNLYRVMSRDCYNGQGRWRYGGRWVGWYWDGSIYCYDIRNETLVSSNNPIPVNGGIFVEDNVWVNGTVNGRVTIGAGSISGQQPYRQIYVTGNLIYAARGSDDVIGLFAQGDIVIPYEAPDTMLIDAALLSQWGTIYRPYYDNNTRNSLTIFGSQIYYLQGGMKYTNGFGNVVSGFINTQYSYDGNLRYFPPPAFPVGNTYELISWEEVL